MKAIQIVLYFSILTSVCFAQKTETDKFTGAVTVTSDKYVFERTLGAASGTAMFIKIDSALRFVVMYKGSMVTSIIPGRHKGIIMFEGGKKIEARYSGSYEVTGRYDGQVFYSMEITREDLEAFKTGSVTDIRLETSNYNADFAVKSKFRAGIQKIAGQIP